MQYDETWIDEENLRPLLEALGWLCGCRFGDEDWQSVQRGIKGVDEEKNVWFAYELSGSSKVRIGISMMSGSSNFTIRLESDKDIQQGLLVAIGLAQEYRIVPF